MSAHATNTVHVAAFAAVCEEAELLGAITIGSRTAVHPKGRIHAHTGPISIGERNFIEDRVLLENCSAGGGVMVIGNGNLFESGCTIRSQKIGDGNWIEPKAETRVGSVIGNNCVIGSGVVIGENEVVPDNTIIVCVQDEHNVSKRIVRAQKDYLVRAQETMLQKYAQTFMDPKSLYALEKNHHLVLPQP